MESYYKKIEAARWRVEHRDFDNGGGYDGSDLWEDKPHHVMYYPSFKGYFIYMILWVHHKEDAHGNTWLGFYNCDHDGLPPFEGKLNGSYEFSLELDEVVPWLSMNYGHLTDAEDYQYLADILAPVYISDDNEKFKISSDLNRHRALQWLNTRITQVTISPVSQPSLGLQWNEPRTEFVELMHALFEAGTLTTTVKGGRTGAIERLGQALGVEGRTPISTVLQDIKNKRNGDRQTPLLDRLRERFLAYLNK
jgi:hypothetical protein